MGWLLNFWMTYKIKIIIGAVALLVISLAFKTWLNKHDDKVYQEGKTAAVVELEKAKKAEWKKIEDQLILDRKALEADAQQIEINQKVLDAKIAEDARHRQREDQLYNQVVNWAKLAKEQINAEVTSVPAAELSNAIRIQSAKLPSTIRR
jgi:hypothetical protein